MRVRFRDGPRQGAALPELVAIVKGDILPSVSRRDSRRLAASVWTSGNRVFACARPDLAAAVLRAALDGTSPDAAVQAIVGRTLTAEERASIRRAEAQWLSILETERNEFGTYLDEQDRPEGLV